MVPLSTFAKVLRRRVESVNSIITMIDFIMLAEMVMSKNVVFRKKQLILILKVIVLLLIVTKIRKNWENGIFHILGIENLEKC